MSGLEVASHPTMHDASPGPPTIWTIGHSNHPLEAFLDLLATHRIDLLIDVRSSPYSRYASQFNRETIDPALQQRKIHYLYLGDQLGGRAADPRFYDNQGRVLYAAVAQSPGFRQGIERLRERLARAAPRSSAARRIPPTATAACWSAACSRSTACASSISAATAARRPRPSWPPKRTSARPGAN